MEIFYFKLLEKSSFIFYISLFLTRNHHKISTIRVNDGCAFIFYTCQTVKAR